MLHRGGCGKYVTTEHRSPADPVQWQPFRYPRRSFKHIWHSRNIPLSRHLSTWILDIGNKFVMWAQLEWFQYPGVSPWWIQHSCIYPSETLLSVFSPLLPPTMTPAVTFLLLHLHSFTIATITGDDNAYLEYLYNQFILRFGHPFSNFLAIPSLPTILLLNQCYRYHIGPVDCILALVGVEYGTNKQIMNAYLYIGVLRRVSRIH